MPQQPLHILQEVEIHGTGQQPGKNTVVISNDGYRSVKVSVVYEVGRMEATGASFMWSTSPKFTFNATVANVAGVPVFSNLTLNSKPNFKPFCEVRKQEATLGYRQSCHFTVPTTSTSASVSCVQLSGNDAPSMLFQNITVEPGKTYRLE